jgi:hypothetical protein
MSGALLLWGLGLLFAVLTLGLIGADARQAPEEVAERDRRDAERRERKARGEGGVRPWQVVLLCVAGTATAFWFAPGATVKVFIHFTLPVAVLAVGVVLALFGVRGLVGSAERGTALGGFVGSVVAVVGFLLLVTGFVLVLRGVFAW